MRTIYLVPHTHYDVAWAFSKEEYLKINESILEEALKLLESPKFRFCLEQTFLLQEIEERMDVEDAWQARAESEETVSWEELKKELEL